MSTLGRMTPARLAVERAAATEALTSLNHPGRNATLSAEARTLVSRFPTASLMAEYARAVLFEEAKRQGKVNTRLILLQKAGDILMPVEKALSSAEKSATEFLSGLSVNAKRAGAVVALGGLYLLLRNKTAK